MQLAVLSNPGQRNDQRTLGAMTSTGSEWRCRWTLDGMVPGGNLR